MTQVEGSEANGIHSYLGEGQPFISSKGIQEIGRDPLTLGKAICFIVNLNVKLIQKHSHRES